MSEGGVPRRRWRGWRLGVLGALGGCLAGSAGYTAYYAHATSYLSNDPRACVNCHIMNDQHASWGRSSHHAVAVCNDCHVPNGSVVRKYAVKAEHGYRHSKGFTLQDFHEPIALTASSRAVVNENCVRCHDGLTRELRTGEGAHAGGGVDCTRCHSGVGHGGVR